MMEKQLIPAGYKQTEVGVIPEDWNISMLGQVCTIVNGRGFKPFEWSERGLPIIRIQNLNGSEEYNYFNGHYDPKIFIEHNQLLFAWSGSRGTSFGPHIWKGGDALLNYHTWKMVINADKIESTFFYHALKVLTKFIEDSAHGASALVHTQKGEMEKFYFPLPSNKQEQTAIANALSDIDALIAALEKLINKKSAIKTAAMQQLLTGKKRLPPFDQLNTGYKQTELGEIPGDWEVKTIGEQSSSYSGGTPSTGNLSYYSGNIPWITSGDLNKERIDSVNGRISQKGLENSSAKMVEAGTLLFALYGATAGISAITYIAGAINQAVLAITPNNKCVTEFLFQMFRMRKSFFIDTYTQGGQPNFSGNIVKSFAIAIPSTLDEQTAIANVLSDMDKDLEALQQRLHKTQQIKQGMMQELLTGKTRLVTAQVAQ